jgi:hypothetical protein
MTAKREPAILQEVAAQAQSLGACNERLAAKGRSILAKVCSIVSQEKPCLTTLEQARAALFVQLEACKVQYHWPLPPLVPTVLC